jgi:hypothetical protein
MILILLRVRFKERGVGIAVSFSLRSVSYIFDRKPGFLLRGKRACVHIDFLHSFIQERIPESCIARHFSSVMRVL